MRPGRSVTTFHSGGTAVAFVLFSALMFGAIVARDRLVDAWKARQLYAAKRGKRVSA